MEKKEACEAQRFACNKLMYCRKSARFRFERGDRRQRFSQVMQRGKRSCNRMGGHVPLLLLDGKLSPDSARMKHPLV